MAVLTHWMAVESVVEEAQEVVGADATGSTERAPLLGQLRTTAEPIGECGISLGNLAAVSQSFEEFAHLP